MARLVGCAEKEIEAVGGGPPWVALEVGCVRVLGLPNEKDNMNQVAARIYEKSIFPFGVNEKICLGHVARPLVPKLSISKIYQITLNLKPSQRIEKHAMKAAISHRRGVQAGDLTPLENLFKEFINWHRKQHHSQRFRA